MRKIDLNTMSGLLINFADAVLIDGKIFADYFFHSDTIVFKKYDRHGNLPEWDWSVQSDSNIRIENGLIICDARSGDDVIEISIGCFQFKTLDAV